MRLFLFSILLLFLFVACHQDISPDIKDEAAVRKVSFEEREILRAL